MAKKADLVQLRGVKAYVCSGGPRDRAWYTTEFWDKARQCAINDGETPHTGRTLGYVLTKGTEDHPRIPGLWGTVLRWNPDAATNNSKES